LASFVFLLQGSFNAVVGQWQNTHSAQDDTFMYFFNSLDRSDCLKGVLGLIEALYNAFRSKNDLAHAIASALVFTSPAA
jgi:hypothetical protein